jgi:hypothetical protein
MKKALMVLTLASTLILAGCGTKPVSSSVSETVTASDSASTSNSASSSSSSSTSPVDPESVYKVSESEFVDFFTNKLANVTIDIVNAPFVKIIFDGMMLEEITARSFGEAQYFTRLDENGIETRASFSGAITQSVSKPFDTGCLDYASAYEAIAGGFLYQRFYFSPLSEFKSSGTSSYGPEYFSVPKETLKKCLQSYYAQLTFDSSTHSYIGSNAYGAGVEKTFLSFKDKLLTEVAVRRYSSSGSLSDSVTYAFSHYGDSAIDELSLDSANYLNYHTVRFYDEDKKTLLDKQYVAYGQSFAYAGSYRRALPDDTGSSTIEGWSLYGSSTLLDSSFFDEDYGNHDLVAKWKTVANSSLYTIDATSGVLTFNGTDGIGSLKVPSTFNDVTVTSLNLTGLTKDLTEIYLPASVGSVSGPSSASSTSGPTTSVAFLSSVEFTVDSTSTKLKVEDGALLNYKGLVLYSYYAGNTAMKYVAPKFVSDIEPYAFTNSKLQEVDLSASSLPTLPAGAFLDSFSLTKVTLPSSLKSIGASAFTECNKLSSINLGATALTSIGDKAFQYDSLLTDVSLPSTLVSIGARAFSSVHLTSLSLPSSIKTLGDSAFNGCHYLTKVTVGASLDAPDLLKGESVFANCEKLADFVIPESVTSIGDRAFFDDLSYAFNLPSNLVSIGEEAFKSTLGPTSLVFPATLTSLGGSAFSEVEALTSVDLSATSLTELKTSLFENCASLTSIKLPATVTTLDSLCLAYTALKTFTITASMKFASDAFSGCASLMVTNLNTTDYFFDSTGHFFYDTAITTLLGQFGSETLYTAPSTLTKINQDVFKNDTALTKVDLSKVTGSLSLTNGSFWKAANLSSIVWPTSGSLTLDYNCFTGTGLTSLELPSNVNIDNAGSGFSGCEKLVSVDLSKNGVTTLDTSVFSGDTALANVTLPSTLATIKTWAFGDDTSLTDLIIPSSVTTIEQDAFADCSADLKLFLEATALPSGYDSDWNALTDSTSAEYLLYSETQPTDTTQRYWHYDTNKKPVIWTVA